MNWFKRSRSQPAPPPVPPPPAPAVDVPLILLVHTHPKDALPPGPLEEGFIELEQDDVVLHGVVGTLQPDGTIADLPEDKLPWAQELTYRHLKREGCLADFGLLMISDEANAGGEAAVRWRTNRDREGAPPLPDGRGS